MTLTTHPHLAPRLKKEYIYTSTPLWTFVICSRVKFTFTFTFIVCVCEERVLVKRNFMSFRRQICVRFVCSQKNNIRGAKKSGLCVNNDFRLGYPFVFKVSHDYTVHAHVCVYCWPCLSSSAVHYNTPPMMTGLLAFYRPAPKHTTRLRSSDSSPTLLRAMHVGCT